MAFWNRNKTPAHSPFPPLPETEPEHEPEQSAAEMLAESVRLLRAGLKKEPPSAWRPCRRREMRTSSGCWNHPAVCR
jgi:hypothetical protein